MDADMAERVAEYRETLNLRGAAGGRAMAKICTAATKTRLYIVDQVRTLILLTASEDAPLYVGYGSTGITLGKFRELSIKYGFKPSHNIFQLGVKPTHRFKKG